MTDKQIIIDGVDVSGCVNLRLEANTSETSYYNACSIGLWQRWYSNLEPSCQMSCYCKNNKDCYYKKWLRKEQECELWNCANIELSSDVKKYKEALEKTDELLELLNDETMVRKDICDRLDEMQNIIAEVLNE